MTLNEQRTKVFLDRYALKDNEGDPVEFSPEEMWDRVAESIATSSAEGMAFRDLLQDFRFVPGGRILAGAGTDSEVTYYNCYVIPVETKARRENRKPAVNIEFENPVESYAYRVPPVQPDPGSDSREAILDTISVMVDIMSRGGGVGINWSVLRPKGTHLSRVNGTTSGPVSWMDVASHAVQTVTQGGSRRGAAMFMLDDWHPDVLEFIDAKRDLSKITGANVSVAVSDAFMDAVRDDLDWDFVFPLTSHPEYNARWDGDIAKWREAGFPVHLYGTMRAREVWQAIATAAWDNGEPGVVFLERYNALSTANGVERIICVNPCGEQGLGPYSVCNLGSMNLDAYIKPLYKYKVRQEGEFEFDWEEFTSDVEDAVTFLDNVVDKNYYFLPENEQVQKNLRRIGLGVMGLADALIALDLRYGSPKAIAFTERVFSTMKTAAIRRSCVLAQTKGQAPAWDKSMAKAPYLREYIGTPLGTQIRKYGLRNLFLLTQAPTGSTSILAGVNSGIEPYFAFEYTRVDRTGTHKVTASAVEKYRREGVSSEPWVTSGDVTVEEHIAMQAAVQKYVDSSVSKTINGPNSHTVEDVQKAYELAYASGLKGLAYFRDGNGRDQVLYKEAPDVQQSVSDADATESLLSELVSLADYAIEFNRPEVLSGRTHKVKTRAGTAYVTVNREPSNSRPVEVFFNVGKAGSDVAAMAEALGRVASLALRKGATLGGVANQLSGVGGNGNFNRAIPDAIGHALTNENRQPADVPPYGDEPAVADPEPDVVPQVVSRDLDLCPECHNASLVIEEGCKKCHLCGYAAC